MAFQIAHRRSCLPLIVLAGGLILLVWNMVYRPVLVSQQPTTCLADIPGDRQRTSLSPPAVISPAWEGAVSEETAKFVRMVAAHASNDNVIVLAGTDSAFVDMAINFYEISLLRFGIRNYLFACTDVECCVTLQRHNITCYVYRQDQSGAEASNYGSKVFLKKMNVRTDMIIDILRAGYSVLHCDTDLVFLKNPLDHIHCGEGCDMAALRDTVDYNAGFIFVRPTKKSLEVYLNMRSLAAKSPKMDDQDQLTHSINSWTKKGQGFKAVSLSNKEFLCGLYYFETGKRVFAGDNPCEKCVVVHNNWIVSKAAKIYRFKEHLMWVYDENQYYSSDSRKYLVYDNPWLFKEEKRTKLEELVALQNALALGAVLNRTVILPAFHVYKKGVMQRAALSFLYLVSKFDSVFGGAYREHMFLHHEKVPEAVKLSRTKPHLIVIPKVNQTLGKSDQVPKDTVLLHLPQDETAAGASPGTIRGWFGGRAESVLVFHSLYQAFGGFTGEEQKQFQSKIKAAFKDADQRQFG